MLKKKINILGNGQLAGMLKEPHILYLDSYIKNISELSISYIFYTKNSYTNFITYETENISVELLCFYKQNNYIYPNTNVLEITQDRLKEKTLFCYLKSLTNDFWVCSVFKKFNQLKFPLMLKTRRFGYDGKGQFFARNYISFEKFFTSSNKKAYIAEEFILFDFEISQIATRDILGNIIFYPIVRNTHSKGILRETIIASKRIVIEKQAKKCMILMLKYFNYVGTLSIEFFVKKNKLYINELAPRVHNSGHWSINGSSVSQFFNHMIAISHNKIIKPLQTKKFISMVNLIGEIVLDIGNNFLRNYNKSLKRKRKMGHINIVSNNRKHYNISRLNIYRQLLQ